VGHHQPPARNQGVDGGSAPDRFITGQGQCFLAALDDHG
jgi:hypothetical protein